MKFGIQGTDTKESAEQDFLYYKNKIQINKLNQ